MTTAMRVGISLGAAALAVLFQSGASLADVAGDTALAKMDEAMNRAQTQYFEYDVTNQEPGKAEKKLALVVRIKAEKCRVEFTAPADMKGTKVLILSPTEMYVYLPAFGKVRRIASNTTDQGFMGMFFAPDDFQTRYGDKYTATITTGSGTEMTLVATAKAGQSPPYSKIEFKVAKDRMLPTELKYFNALGQNVKTETRRLITCQGKICTATEQKMVDNVKGGAWTQLARKTWKVNEPMADELFTRRALEK
jgi:hypothetical protein